jgi:hypothetical protein
MAEFKVGHMVQALTKNNQKPFYGMIKKIISQDIGEGVDTTYYISHHPDEAYVTSKAEDMRLVNIHIIED